MSLKTILNEMSILYNMNWRTKSLIYIIGIMVALFVYYHITKQAEIRALQLERDKEIESIKDREKEVQDSILAEMKIQKEQFLDQVQDLQMQSDKLNKLLKYYENRPDIDIDFITSANIISKSEYKSGE